MKSRPRHPAAFTRVELIIGAIVVFALGLLLIPLASHLVLRAQMAETLQNMRALWTASYQMYVDRATAGKTRVGWPGDMEGSFTNWEARAVPDYMSTNDLCDLLSAPGRKIPPGQLPSFAESAILLYAVSTNTPPRTVFLSTANFTNTPAGGVLATDAAPYGRSGFIIVDQGGRSLILKAGDAGNTNSVGAYAPLCR